MPNSLIRMNPSSLPDAGKIGYSQISIAKPHRLAFVSGQVAWHADGRPAPDTLAEQTSLVVTNLKAVLHELETSPDAIVQMRIYIKKLNDEAMGIAIPIIMDFLNGSQPSITGVGVDALAAPELLIEVEIIVQLPA